jgi:hypothetical protein
MEEPYPVPADAVMRLRRATEMPVTEAKRLLASVSPLLRTRLLAAADKQLEANEETRQYLYDPIEDDPAYAQTVRQAAQEAEEELRSVERRRGFCHLLWKTQKRILRDRYRIEWFTPAEMNIGVIFD